MQISKNKVVTIDYKLRDDQGQMLDSSEKEEPLVYLHGTGNMVPGLENALEGKATGDAFNVAVPAAEGFGERDESLVWVLPRKRFKDIRGLKPGLQMELSTKDGDVQARVTRVQAEEVTLDGNHPLAGVALQFDVLVLDVRDASPEELEHGHVHGHGGHHH